jgi:hypothetical protein
MTRVTLSVGGTRFHTTEDTLCMQGGYFRSLMNMRSGNEDVFIDRDPTFFRWVLNLLRGSVAVPLAYEDYAQLAVEADFYGVAMPPFPASGSRCGAEQLLAQIAAAQVASSRRA